MSLWKVVICAGRMSGHCCVLQNWLQYLLHGISVFTVLIGLVYQYSLFAET